MQGNSLKCNVLSSDLLWPSVIDIFYYAFTLGYLRTGHNSVLHACTVEDEAFVGMGSTILDGAVVERGSMVAAGSTVTQKTRVPTGQVI
jgi:carbonic anhydrase/acetyltransferase-like protein (isoleucine patch superfamily)